jgi:hypothetical protein
MLSPPGALSAMNRQLIRFKEPDMKIAEIQRGLS